uniref:Uncharacterized protein n=1 Tax=Oryza meridionalis TaxID=40149 RepID=A0A0E0D153_9ORYZ
MAGPYAPQLTRWRAAVGGRRGRGAVVRDFVEHTGSVIALRPEDYYHRTAAATGEEDDDGGDDPRERVLLGGRLYPVADETTTTTIHGGVGGGGRTTLRCVEFCPEPGVAPLRLTVTAAAAAAEEEEKQRQEVAEVVSPDGAVRVLGRGECFVSGGERGTVQHVVDVEGEREVFVLLVSVRPELARIVRVQRLT